MENKMATDKKAVDMGSTKKEGFKNKAGDLLEKVGHKISNAGATKIGQKIHDLGDDLEKDHKNPSHPHKV